MRPLEKFTLLHEVGHTGIVANLNYDLYGVYTPLLLSLGVVAVRQQEIKAKIWKPEPSSDDSDKYVLATGTTARLFMPKEVDLYVNKQTLETYIYHGKVIDYDISHLLYLPVDHSIVVVMNDQTRLDLGIKLQSLVRPYFLKGKEINIVRTKDRKPMEAITVPFWKGV